MSLLAVKSIQIQLWSVLYCQQVTRSALNPLSNVTRTTNCRGLRRFGKFSVFTIQLSQ